ncbi:MAG: galactose mutarotase [Clostridiales bacterium]|jgi:aldose 1-epimerase|nr:galactose mutarotase [Clostridiales bacterium]
MSKSVSFGDATLFTLHNGALTAQISTLGATVVSVVVPDRDGNPVNVVAGYETYEAARTKEGYLGAVIGRVANRVKDGVIRYKGKELRLERNDNGNSLHSGGTGLHTRIWTVEAATDTALMLSCTTTAEGGFPGTFTVRTVYRLSPDTLTLTYTATATEDTPCNLTNHAYFCLQGAEAAKTSENGIYSTQIRIDADGYLSADETLIPLQRTDVEGTPFDLRKAVAVGDRIETESQDLKKGGGFDHHFFVNGTGWRVHAEAYCPETGIVLTAYSDLPGVQFYAGNFMGAGTAPYKRRSAFCLETQHAPNSCNDLRYDNMWIDAKKTTFTKTAYRFSVR